MAITNFTFGGQSGTFSGPSISSSTGQLSGFDPERKLVFADSNLQNPQTYGGFQFGQNPATSGLQNVSNSAQFGTIANFNTAANRLRERLDAQKKSFGQQAINQNVGSGFGASGRTGRDLGRLNQQSQFAFGQGLSDLEQGFEGLRQQGLQTALGAQKSIGDQFLGFQGLQAKDFQDTNSLNSSNFNQFQDRKQRDVQDINQLTLDEIQGANQLNFDTAALIDKLKTDANIAEGAAVSGNISQLIGQLLSGL